MCEKCEIPLPHDLTVHSFSAGNVEYADDCDLCGTDPDGLIRTRDLLHSVCRSIGLDISVKKTEWICLHNPDTASLCQLRGQGHGLPKQGQQLLVLPCFHQSKVQNTEHTHHPGLGVRH